jgi:DHA1 family inner membrane transport protein
MPLPILALFVTAFAFGTTEFVIAGILPELASGLGVSIPAAGFLVSGYALGIAIGGPLLTIVTTAMARKRLLLIIALVFVAGQFACALAPGYASMLLFRVVTACAHGVFFGVAMVVAIGLVPLERRGMAVAVVLAGLTVSNIVGVPLGAAIGNAFGWRATFWAMFGLGIVTVFAILLLVPDQKGARPAPPRLSQEIGVLGRQQVWTSLIVMLMLMMCQYVPFTYISPLLQEVTRLDAATIPWVLLINGLGATLGVWIGGKLADWKLMPSLIVLLVVQSGVAACLYLFSPSPLAMVVLVPLWGCINFSIGTPLQTRILSWTTDAPNLASSLIPAGFNLGIAIAAFVGGQIIAAGLGYRALPLVGVVSMLIAAGVAAASWSQERRSGASAAPPAAA